MWRLAEDTIGQADLEALGDWLASGPQLTQGPLVAEFERRWSQWQGSAFSIMVSSGSTANLALVTALHLAHPHERPLHLAASSVTWSTNVTPSVLYGHELTLVDINPRTLGMDPAVAYRLITEDACDAIFITHLLGFNAATTELLDAIRLSGKILIEDCCEAHGSKLGESKVGTLGLASTFSFYFGHHMSTVEGGMISTDDPDLADRLRLLRDHGLARASRQYDDYARMHSQIDRRFLFVLPGMNYRSTEIGAFLGLRQLDLIDGRIDHRNANLDIFLDMAPEWLWKDFERAGASSFAIPLIAVDSVGFDVVRATIERLGIESRPIVAGNLARQPFLAGYPRLHLFPEDLAVANHVHDFGLYVGNGHHVEQSMVAHLCEQLHKAR